MTMFLRFVLNRKSHLGPGFIAGCMICLAVSVVADDPKTHNRYIAAYGPRHGDPPETYENVYKPKPCVWEPAIAIGEQKVLILFNAGPALYSSGGYSIASRNAGAPGGWEWSEDNMPWLTSNPYTPCGPYNPKDPDFVVLDRSIDHSVVFNTHDPGVDTDNEFLAATMSAVSHYDIDAGEFSPWRVTIDSGPSDRHWLVAGGDDEFYVVGGDNGYSYRRSTDAGCNWDGGRVTVGGTPIPGRFAPHPSVYQDRPLYMAHPSTAVGIRVVSGVDTGDPPPDPPVTFSFLCTDIQQQTPLEIVLNATNEVVTAALPGHLGGWFHNWEVKRVPMIAVDPTDADRVYVAYHDTSKVGGADVNVYLNVLTRNPTTDEWTDGGRITVNQDPTNVESDQFLPAVAVDEQGRVHVVYYSDYRYRTGPEQQTDDTLNPKFDAHYVVVTFPQGVPAFDWFELVSDPNEPAIDFTVNLTWNNWAMGGYGPGEYNDIWFKKDPFDGSNIWTAIAGTSSRDRYWEGEQWHDEMDQSVIHYAHMHFSPDLDNDGCVNLSDLAALLASYNKCRGDPAFNTFADFDANGCVDLSDLAKLLSHYDAACE
jgi:hypothetical protein